MKEVMVRSEMNTSTKKISRLLGLIRDKTVPEALLQLRYAKPTRSTDLMHQIQEGIAKAGRLYAIPKEDLKVAFCRPMRRKCVQKKPDFKGRGRMGIIRKQRIYLDIVLREIDKESNDPWKVPGKRARGHKHHVREFKRRHKARYVPE